MENAIRQLDKRFAALKPLKDAKRPPKGWLRAIRDALGMTSAQFARRLGVSQPRIVKLEQAEIDGSVTLRSLERAAEALGCSVVYALVPNRSLAETVDERVRSVARRRLESVAHTMALENQAVPGTDMRSQSERPSHGRVGGLWNDP